MSDAMQSIKPTLGRIDAQLYFADLILPKKPRKEFHFHGEQDSSTPSVFYSSCLLIASDGDASGQSLPLMLQHATQMERQSYGNMYESGTLPACTMW